MVFVTAAEETKSHSPSHFFLRFKFLMRVLGKRETRLTSRPIVPGCVGVVVLISETHVDVLLYTLVLYTRIPPLSYSLAWREVTSVLGDGDSSLSTHKKLACSHCFALTTEAPLISPAPSPKTKSLVKEHDTLLTVSYQGVIFR